MPGSERGDKRVQSTVIIIERYMTVGWRLSSDKFCGSILTTFDGL
jgi:hypothetical protein